MADKITKAAVLAALSKVQEPELHKDLVTLNMVQDLKITGDKVSFTVVLTTPACPLRGKIEKEAREAVLALPVRASRWASPPAWDAGMAAEPADRRTSRSSRSPASPFRPKIEKPLVRAGNRPAHPATGAKPGSALVRPQRLPSRQPGSARL